MARVPAAHDRDGRYTKDDFGVDLEAGTVTCPAGQTAPIRWHGDGGGPPASARRAPPARWPKSALPTGPGGPSASTPTSRSSRPTRPTSRPPNGRHAYTATRPKVERKIGHFVSRLWGGRKARTRGQDRDLHRRRHPGRGPQLEASGYPRSPLERRGLGRDRTMKRGVGSTLPLASTPPAAPTRPKTPESKGEMGQGEQERKSGTRKHQQPHRSQHSL